MPINHKHTLFTGGRIFTADPENPWAEALVVSQEKVLFVGDTESALLHGKAAAVYDLNGGLVVPGFVDGHVHISMTGAAMLKAQLQDAGSLEEIQRRVKAWADKNPDAPRVLGTNWVHGDIPGGVPSREMLDNIVPDRPVYLEAYDYHSSWVNTAALEELGITDDTPDPVGGRIVREESSGRATGYLLENASVNYVWSLLGNVSEMELEQHIRTALGAFARAGITTVVDMAMEEPALRVLENMYAAGTLPVRVIAHMIIWRDSDPAKELAMVERAARLAEKYQGDGLRVAGIKIIADGTIDSCTAALSRPYTNGENAGPIWPADVLNPVVVAADHAGLQVAIHAIGDQAVTLAVDAMECAMGLNNSSGRRHRIEHLEYAKEQDIERMGRLGITASMQPVHVDPAYLDNWREMLGPERANQGWAWPLYQAAGSKLAFGTDTPTAPYFPLINMYLASTRKSPKEPSAVPVRPDWALKLDSAIVAGTRDSAWASWLDHCTGTLKAGLAADLVVLDQDVIAGGADSLLNTNVRLTLVNGKTTFQN